MDYDAPGKRGLAAEGDLLDLPIGPGAGSSSDGHESPPAAAGRGDERPPTLGAQSTTPRHQRRRPEGRKRRLWPLIVLGLLVVCGLVYGFFLRPPVAEASVMSLEFDATLVGRQGEVSMLEIRNRGRRRLVVEKLGVVGEASGDYQLTSDGCSGAMLAAEEGCVVELLFAPRAAGGRAATVEIVSNAPDSPLLVALTGSGLAPALAADRSQFDFGRISVGKASAATALKLLNRGTAPLAIARLAIEGSGEASFIWVANGCSGQTLEPGTDCALRIAFQPRETGSFKAELRVWSDAPEDPRIALSGVGIAPGLFIDPAALDFGQLRPGQQSASQTVRLGNTGNAPLVIDRVVLSGAGSSAFELLANSCDGQTLEGDVDCSLAVRYRPREAARHAAVLEIRAPGLRRRAEVALSGAALAPRIAVSETVVDFGQIVQYATNERSVTVSNSGSAPLALDSIEIEGGGGAFGISERGCPELLAVGADCRLGLRFSASRVGAAAGRLSIRHNASAAPTIINLVGTAGSLPQAGVTLSAAEIQFGALAVGERSDFQTIKVRSDGNAKLGLEGYEIVGPNAGDFRIVPASCEGLQTLLPGSDCSIGLGFRPQGAGPRTARLVVRHGAAGGSSEVRLSGEGY